MPDACPEPNEDAKLEDLNDEWHAWYKYEWDPYCDSIWRARRVHGVE